MDLGDCFVGCWFGFGVLWLSFVGYCFSFGLCLCLVCLFGLFVWVVVFVVVCCGFV